MCSSGDAGLVSTETINYLLKQNKCIYTNIMQKTMFEYSMHSFTSDSFPSESPNKLVQRIIKLFQKFVRDDVKYIGYFISKLW